MSYTNIKINAKDNAYLNSLQCSVDHFLYFSISTIRLKVSYIFTEVSGCVWSEGHQTQDNLQIPEIVSVTER